MALANIVLEQMGTGVIAIEHTGLVSLYNHAAQEILGVPADRVVFAPKLSLAEQLLFQFQSEAAVWLRASGLGSSATLRWSGRLQPLDREVQRLERFARAPRASDGCVVLSNQDLRTVGNLIQVGLTPVIIDVQMSGDSGGRIVSRVPLVPSRTSRARFGIVPAEM